ncbi:unnamed protein product [Leuciscus chuanchicus]
MGIDRGKDGLLSEFFTSLGREQDTDPQTQVEGDRAVADTEETPLSRGQEVTPACEKALVLWNALHWEALCRVKLPVFTRYCKVRTSLTPGQRNTRPPPRNRRILRRARGWSSSLGAKRTVQPKAPKHLCRALMNQTCSSVRFSLSTGVTRGQSLAHIQETLERCTFTPVTSHYIHIYTHITREMDREGEREAQKPTEIREIENEKWKAKGGGRGLREK